MPTSQPPTPALSTPPSAPLDDSGPVKDYVGTELTVQAMNGVMYIHGDGEARPCMVPVEQLYRVAGFHIVVGVMAAVHARHRTGRGQQVDVSLCRTLACGSS